MAEINFPQFGQLDAREYKSLKIRSTAAKIRALCGQSDSLIFDPFSCADNLGINVEITDLPHGCSGMLRVDSAAATIELSNREKHDRHRFTLCHELAHLCFWESNPALPEERGVKNSYKRVTSREEAICNQIASELLMPHALFRKHAVAMTPSFESITSLARRFDVSVFAVIRRLSKDRTAVWSVGRSAWKLEGQTTVVRSEGVSTVFPRRILKTDRVRLTWRFSEAFRATDIELKRDANGLGLLIEQLERNRYVVVGNRAADVVVWRSFPSRFENTNRFLGAVFT